MPSDLHLSPQHQLPPAHCVSSYFSPRAQSLQLLACHRVSVGLLQPACIRQILYAYTDLDLCGGQMEKSAWMDHVMVVTMTGSHLHHLCHAMCMYQDILS